MPPTFCPRYWATSRLPNSTYHVQLAKADSFQTFSRQFRSPGADRQLRAVMPRAGLAPVQRQRFRPASCAITRRGRALLPGGVLTGAVANSLRLADRGTQNNTVNGLLLMSRSISCSVRQRCASGRSMRPKPSFVRAKLTYCESALCRKTRRLVEE